jgi:thiol-disulfide isomerase/thioredoxin
MSPAAAEVVRVSRVERGRPCREHVGVGSGVPASVRALRLWPRMRRTAHLLSCFLLVLLAAAPASAAPRSVPPSGLWDGTLSVGAVDVPFRFELSVQGSKAKGAFFNGDARVRSTRGTFTTEGLALEFEHYASALQASWADGALRGTYSRPGTSYGFRAVPHVASAPLREEPPAIDGPWEIAVKSPKGESAWRLFIRQAGPSASASILRVDGDTGQLDGSYHGGKFLLSHFSGARPLLLELELNADGSLAILENGKTRYAAVRSAEARTRHLPEPADPSRWTSVKDPTQPLRFTARSLEGAEVTDSDPRFARKVVLVNIMGSWCPNCHDEAPFLAALYRKYRKQGLQVVAISFEDAEQLKNPSRLRAFIKEYGIEFPVLLGGEPAELAVKLPQAVNLNTWPATFFIGRDGLVRGAHAGFAGKATGKAHDDLVREITVTIEKLLAEKP